MGGRAEPPEGTPEGGPGGEDEFRSVVFDESFVRAARIQELSAQERMSSGTRPIRRSGLRGSGLSRQALALMLLVSMAFAAAVYLGTKHPYPTVRGNAAELSISVIPLTAGPGGVPTLVPDASGSASAAASGSAAPSDSASASATASGSASSSASPQAGAGASPSVETSPQEYAIGVSGLNLPLPRHTDNFSKAQVGQALKLVQNYLEASSLSSSVLFGGHTDVVRNLLASGQYPQFDQSISKPTDDRRHEATGWMVRFDARQVKSAPGEPIRDQGTMSFAEVGPDSLELTSDATFVYALVQTPAAIAAQSAAAAASSTSTPDTTAGVSAPNPTVLFTVRRQITYRVSAADIDDGHLELSDSVTQVGATSCGADQSRFLQPVFPQPGTPQSAFAPSTHAHASAKASSGSAADKQASGSATAAPTPTGATAGTDPFDQDLPAWAVCGVMTGPTP